MDGAFRRAGVRVNFARGKTEFLPVVTGRNSKSLRHQWLCQQEPSFQVETPSANITVHMTAQYTHLGSEVDDTGSDLSDLRRCRSLARDLSRALSKLMRNPNLELREKVDMLISMPIARFKHGAGLWALRTSQERRLFRHAYTEPLRRSFRAICGFSSRGVDDESLFLCLGVMTPDQVRTADLLRHAGWF